MHLVPSRRFIRRLIAILWVAAYVWLLARTLVLRNASPQVFGDEAYLEQIYILGLSSPLSAVVVWPLRWVSFSWWIYPANDARTIVAIWFCFFAAGCLQWFVLVPWIVHKGYDLYDLVFRLVRRK
jgi:hypothetical protein